MSVNIQQALSSLPTSGVTVSLLNALDSIVPGQWENITSFEAMIPRVTGLTQPGIVEDVRARALALSQDDSKQYDKALWLFQSIDTMDRVAAGATVASKVSDFFGGLDFVKDLAPKPETTQALDAGLKLIAEIMAFGFLKGLPELTFEEVAHFVVALQKYGKADIMRLASWVIVDGMLPLGPNFMRTIIDTTQSVATSKVAGHSIFGAISDRLPGDSPEQKQAFVGRALEQTSSFIEEFVQARGITHESIQQHLGGVIDIADGGADYVAAALDASTNYFSHTGTQTVARALIEEAFEQLQADVWSEYVARHS